MKVIDVPAIPTIGACESLLQELEQTTQDVSISLPKKGSFLAVGNEAALCQFIISWSQKAQHPILKTTLKETRGYDEAASLTQHMYGLVSILCSEKTELMTGGDCTEFLQAKAFNTLSNLQGPEPETALKGPQFLTLCADHFEKKYPFLFYKKLGPNDFEIRNRSDFRSVAKSILNDVLRKNRIETWHNEFSDSFGSVLFEVFKNTEDHALLDLRGKVLTKSMRGIYVRFFGIPIASIPNIASGFAPLEDYLSSRAKCSNGKQLQMLELSIFDSGIGFAQSWTRRPLESLTIEAEIDAVQACFSEQTRKSRKEFGQGLPHVLRLLNQRHGFLRLRTGRLSLYQDCFDPRELESSILRTHQTAQGPTFPIARGSLLTFLIPVE